MEEMELPQCAKCPLEKSEKACRDKNGKAPRFCPTRQLTEVVAKSQEPYMDIHIREFARQASIQEGECYINREAQPPVLHPIKPRLQEICEFAGKMGYKRLGLAYCIGLQAEATALTRVLEGHGFNTVSVVCKVGCTPKENIGLTEKEKVRPGQFESMCSPITQAEVLNEAQVDFNIIMGLCVGHDSLFFKYAQAPTTVFAVKDRVLGHNPLAALYTLGSYYERLIKKPKS